MTGLSLFDMHCHLDFAPDARAAARGLAECGAGAFSATVDPAGFERASELLAGCENVRVGLGLHPWWVADGRCGSQDAALFEQLVACERFVGEIGLDFSPARAFAREAQLAVFERVAAACAEGGKVLSIHAVRSASEVLDILERTGALERNACVFHWFSGTSDELQRALRAGCFCSISPRMLASKRGRAYARAVPEGRLLLETDSPSEEGAPFDPKGVATLLSSLLDDLAALRAVSRADLAARIAETSARLLAL